MRVHLEISIEAVDTWSLLDLLDLRELREGRDSRGGELRDSLLRTFGVAQICEGILATARLEV
jgi:hypothetical protein